MQAVIDRRTVLRYLLLPALAGLMATLVVYGLLARRGAVPAQAAVPVVVTRRVVPARTVLTSALLTVKAFPRHLVGPTAIHSVKAAIGRTVTQPLAQDEVLYGDVLARPGDRSALSYHIPAGLRGVSVAVNEQAAVADLLQPGDRVDVVAVKPGRTAVGASGGTPPSARIVLSDRLVLAVAQSQQAGTKPPNPSHVHTVTLALSPSEAVALVAAQEGGPIRLLLDPAAGQSALAASAAASAGAAGGGGQQTAPGGGGVS